MKPANQAGLVLNFGEVGLRPDDDITDALAGDAVIFGDLGQREVLVVIEVVEFLLPVCEQIAVKVEEQGHTVSLILHVHTSICIL